MGLFAKKESGAAARSNQIIIITGCAGSGKTTIGKKLSQAMGYAYVDKDTVTREFTDFILCRSGSTKGDRESELYKNEILPVEYSVTLKLCREIVENSCGVVLTIPFIGQIRDFGKWEELRAAARIDDGIDVKFVWIEHDIDSEKNNIERRKAERDAYKLAHWDEYSSGIEGIEPDVGYNAKTVINDRRISVDDIAEDIKKWAGK